MRIIIGLVFLLGFGFNVGAQGSGGPRTELLSYDELMRLSSPQRITYLHDLAGLLVIMEQQTEGKYQFAANETVREGRSLIARWLQDLEVLPGAQAQKPIGADVESITWDDPTPLNKPFTPAVRPTTPAPPVTPPAEAAKAPAEPVAPKPGPAELPKSCEMTKDERSKLVREFRKGAEFTHCIAGGFFTEKDSSRKRGSCKWEQNFRFMPKTKKNSGLFSCTDPNKTLCNPVLFCIEFGDIQVRGAKQDVPSTICARRGPHVTEGCLQEYNEIVSKRKLPDLSDAKADKNPEAQAVYRQMLTQKARACDPTKVRMDSLKDGYTEMKEKTEKYYRDLCLKESTFSKLFCTECKIIGDQLKVVLKVVNGRPAPAATTTTPPTSTAPATN